MKTANIEGDFIDLSEKGGFGIWGYKFFIYVSNIKGNLYVKHDVAEIHNNFFQIICYKNTSPDLKMVF